VRNVGLSLMVVVYVVLMIFFLVRDHKDDLSNALDNSLDFIGSKLNAMVAEPSEKEEIVKVYDDFKKKVKDKQIPPDQVESIAANILNLSNSGVTITHDQAENILQYGYVIGVKSDSVLIDSLRYNLSDPEIPIVSLGVEPREPVKDEELVELSLRLGKIHEFDKKMHETMKDRFRDKRKERREFLRHMRYDSQNGLRLMVDSQAKEQVASEEYAELDKELGLLQKEKILVYQKNLIKELEKEKQRIEHELKLVIEAKKKREKNDEYCIELGVLESIKKLELDGLTTIFTPDSINSFIIKVQQKADSIRTDAIKKQKGKSKK